MTSTSTSGQGFRLADTPEDEYVIIHALAVFALAAFSALGVLWYKGVGWLVVHQMLIPSSAHPVLVLPYTRGTGLDWSRILILVAAVVGLLALAISAARRAALRRRAAQ